MAQTLASDRASESPTQPGRLLGGETSPLRRGIGAWLFLFPAVVFFVGYQVYPIFRVVWISFTDDKFLSSKPPQWVGFDNYIQALHDPLMWAGLWRAFQFTIMFLPGTIILPLLLAILVDRVTNPRLATFYRVVLLIPALIPSTLVFVLWEVDVQLPERPDQSSAGRHAWSVHLAERAAVAGRTALTLPAIAFMENWWGLGYHTIFFLAGLAGDFPRSCQKPPGSTGRTNGRSSGT